MGNGEWGMTQATWTQRSSRSPSCRAPEVPFMSGFVPQQKPTQLKDVDVNNDMVLLDRLTT